MEIYWYAKYQWDISIHCWDKTTSSFGKRTAAILEFYFRSRFWPMYSHQDVVLHFPAKVRSNRSIGGGFMTSYPFLKMAADSHNGFDLGNVRPPTKFYSWSQLDLQIWSWSFFYSFGDTVIFIFCPFGLKLPIHAHFRGFGSIRPPKMISISLTPKRTIPARKHVVWAIKPENRSSGSTWAHCREKR